MLKKNLSSLIRNVLISQFTVLLLGCAALGMFTDFAKAFKYGFLFFIPAEVIKCIAIVSIYSFIKKDFSKTER